MFRALTISGGAASILYGYRQAATLTSWRITKRDGRWTLTATVARVDRFMARQKPLLFTAPRAKGFWAWGVTSMDVGTNQLVATLGPPEQ